MSPIIAPGSKNVETRGSNPNYKKACKTVTNMSTLEA
jgi:hypothetical protein